MSGIEGYSSGGAARKFNEGGPWEDVPGFSVGSSSSEGFGAHAAQVERTPDYSDAKPAEVININTRNVPKEFKSDEQLAAEALQDWENEGGATPLEREVDAEVFAEMSEAEEEPVIATPQDVIFTSRRAQVELIGKGSDVQNTDFEDEGPNDEEAEADAELRVLDAVRQSREAARIIDGSPEDGVEIDSSDDRTKQLAAIAEELYGSDVNEEVERPEPLVLGAESRVPPEEAERSDVTDDPFVAKPVSLDELVPENVKAQQDVRTAYPNVFSGRSKIKSHIESVEETSLDAENAKESFDEERSDITESEVVTRTMPEIDVEVLGLGANESVEFSVIGMGELIHDLHNKRKEIAETLLADQGSQTWIEFENVYAEVVDILHELREMFEGNWSVDDLREHTRAVNWQMGLLANVVTILKEEKELADRGLHVQDGQLYRTTEKPEMTPEEQVNYEIEATETFDDLYGLLYEIEGLEYDGDSYDAQTLISVIEAYRAGKIELDSVPDIYALSVRVQELKDAEGGAVHKAREQMLAERKGAYENEMERVHSWQEALRARAQGVDVWKTDSENRALFRELSNDLVKKVETHQMAGEELTQEAFVTSYEKLEELHDAIVTYEDTWGDETMGERLKAKAELVKEVREKITTWEAELKDSRDQIDSDEAIQHYQAHRRSKLKRKISELQELLAPRDNLRERAKTFFNDVESLVEEIEAEKAAIVTEEASREDIFAATKERINADEAERHALDGLQEEMQNGVIELKGAASGIEDDYADVLSQITDPAARVAATADLGGKIETLKARIQHLERMSRMTHDLNRTSDEIEGDFGEKFESLKGLIADINTDIEAVDVSHEMPATAEDSTVEAVERVAPEQPKVEGVKIPAAEKNEAQTSQEILQKAFLRVQSNQDDAEWVGSWWGKRGAKDEELRDFLRVKPENSKFKKMIAELKTQAGAFAPREDGRMLVGEYVDALVEGVAKAQRRGATRLRQDVIKKVGIEE